MVATYNNISITGSFDSRIVVPADFASNKFWADGADASTITYGISPAIAQIDDKSGENNHATQVTPSLQPNYVLGGMNNRNTMSFPGTAKLFIPNLQSVLGEDEDFTVSVVFTLNDLSTVRMLFYSTDATLGRMMIAYGSNILTCRTQSNDSRASAAFTDTSSPHIVTMINSNSVVSAYLDGVEMTGNDVAGAFSAAQGTSLGDRVGGGYLWNGLIPANAVFAKAFSTDEREGLEGGFAQKWGVTLP
jgi:hypothetical protein